MKNLDKKNLASQEKIIRHGAYGIVQQDFNILLTQKKAGPYQGLWGLPGGAIEFGETPEKTLTRELLEESALVATQLEFFNTITATGEYYKNSQPYGFHQVGLIYKVLGWSEQPNSLPQEENRWISLNSIVHQELTPFASQTISLLEKSSKTWRPSKQIRGKAIGLIEHDEKLLVCEVLDDEGRLKGWCPLGGGIEFSEKAEEGVKREIREELKCEIKITGDPIMCENIFKYHDLIGHEIVFAFPVMLENKSTYYQKRFQIHESRGSSHWVEWIPIENFKQGKVVLFPEVLTNKIPYRHVSDDATSS